MATSPIAAWRDHVLERTDGAGGQAQGGVESGREGSGGATRLAGVALVAALLLSTSRTPRSRTPCSSSGSNGLGLDRCSEDVVYAFVAAATRCAYPRRSDGGSRTDAGRCDAADGNPSSGAKGCEHGAGANRSCSSSRGEPSTTANCSSAHQGDNCGRARRDPSYHDYGCATDSARSSVCGCACAFQPRGQSPEEERKHRILKKELGRDRSRRRAPRLRRGSNPLGSTSTRESARKPVGSSDGRHKAGGVLAWCAADECSVEDEQGIEGEEGEDERRFVCLWSQVQSAAWHVNACLDALRLTESRKGTGGIAFDPLRLRPALALELFYKRRQNRHIRGSDRPNEPPVVGAQRQPVRARAAKGATASGEGSRAKNGIAGRASRPSGGKIVRGESLLVEATQLEGSAHKRPHRWLAEGCQGTCPWACRTDTVLEAAGLGFSA